MVEKYIPKQGDIVFVDFNLTKGHEQTGLRPYIVISNNIFNEHTKMVIVCPITSNEKEFPTHYLLKNTKKFMSQYYVNMLEVLIMKYET